jgi:hypothetical protein
VVKILNLTLEGRTIVTLSWATEGESIFHSNQYQYFSNLASVPSYFKSRLQKIKNKLKLLEEGNINFSP